VKTAKDELSEFTSHGQHMLIKGKSFRVPEFHEPTSAMMLRKSNSVIECSPPAGALVS